MTQPVRHQQQVVSLSPRGGSTRSRRGHFAASYAPFRCPLFRFRELQYATIPPTNEISKKVRLISDRVASRQQSVRTRFIADANDLQANAFLHESGLWCEAHCRGSRPRTGARVGPLTVSCLTSGSADRQRSAINEFLIGYARVSTNEQGLTAQRNGLENLGVRSNLIYTDHVLTGTNRARPGLREAVAACRDGDTLVVADGQQSFR